MSGRTPEPSQRWLTFVHNHAQAIVARDVFVVFTARFRIPYVLLIIKLGRRGILRPNVGRPEHKARNNSLLICDLREWV